MLSSAALAVVLAVRPAPASAPLAPEAFAARRQRVAAELPTGGLAVLRGAPDLPGSSDPYRQDSAFWYLTGIDETNVTAVLTRDEAGVLRYLLFVQPRNPVEDQWTGFRAGVEGARERFRADEALPAPDLWEQLPKLWRGATSLSFLDGGDRPFREKLLDEWTKGDADASSARPMLNLEPVVARLRRVKEEAELGLLRRAVDLSLEAHRAAMAAVAPGRNEAELKADMVRTCLEGGAARMAYAPIVGSGPNSVILHYDRADRDMQAGEMLVNDTACEYQMYAADVTRSYPVSGRFSPEQKAIYEIVLAAQKAGMEKVRPGTRVHEVYEATVAVVAEGLVRLGLLQGDPGEIVRDRSFRKFYPHGCCHWLGLDVHDAGSYGLDQGDYDRRERYFHAQATLEPGMVLTVEPGIYVPEGSTEDRRWWNIGARIEDDVLVTAAGPECLSCALPRELPALEAALGRRR